MDSTDSETSHQHGLYRLRDLTTTWTLPHRHGLYRLRDLTQTWTLQTQRPHTDMNSTDSQTSHRHGLYHTDMDSTTPTWTLPHGHGLYHTNMDSTDSETSHQHGLYRLRDCSRHTHLPSPPRVSWSDSPGLYCTLDLRNKHRTMETANTTRPSLYQWCQTDH